MEIKDSLRKEYAVTIVAKGVKALKVTFPYEVAEREARKRGLSLKDFLEQYQVIAQYDNFDGVFYSFSKKEE